MDLDPYLDSLRRGLANAAAPGGAEIARAAELLAVALEPSVRLSLLDVLSDAAAEITEQLSHASVELRIRGREADLVVSDATAEIPAPPPVTAEGADQARVSLRLPEHLKQQAEQAAATEGISVNAWLIRAVAAALQSPGQRRPGRTGRVDGRPHRITGFAQA
jgi:predicted HicB family RNase H-like nuclease